MQGCRRPAAHAIIIKGSVVHDDHGSQVSRVLPAGAPSSNKLGDGRASRLGAGRFSARARRVQLPQDLGRQRVCSVVMERRGPG